MLEEFRQGAKNLSTANRIRLFFIVLMQVGFVASIVISIIDRNWLTMFVAVVALVIVWLPTILGRSFHIRLPLEFEFLLNLFIFASIILGEQGFYYKFWWWDIALHAGAGIALGFVGFLLLFSLYKAGKLYMSPVLLVSFAFCFAVSLGVVWEIFEFSMDSFFSTNMQKPMFRDYSGLTDTMWDLTVNALGAVITSVVGYLYLKRGPKNRGLFEHYLNLFITKNEKK